MNLSWSIKDNIIAKEKDNKNNTKTCTFSIISAEQQKGQSWTIFARICCRMPRSCHKIFPPTFLCDSSCGWWHQQLLSMLLLLPTCYNFVFVQCISFWRSKSREKLNHFVHYSAMPTANRTESLNKWREGNRRGSEGTIWVENECVYLNSFSAVIHKKRINLLLFAFSLCF